MSSNSSLKIQDLVIQIGEQKIINEISLDIKKGQAVGIIGPNGSGKTTLFNAISGFADAKSGKIFFNSKDITRLSPSQRAHNGLARVFQNSGVFRDMTVEENIIIALEAKHNKIDNVISCGKTYKKFAQQAKELLSDVKLESKIKEKASSLSGGQLRLVEIIRALAFGADIFLLDEPTAGVSPKMKDEVLNQVYRIKGLGKTILIIEHDINLIERFCDRILVLDAGKVVMDDSPSNIRESKMLHEIYFGSGSY